MNFSVVQDLFLSVDGIVAVHNLRIWGLTTDKTALSAHLAISELLFYRRWPFTLLRNGHDVTSDQRIKSKLAYYSTTSV